MNYRYRMIDADFVLSKQEHEYCVAQFKKGTNIIALRNDTFLVNMAMLKSASPTDLPTDAQYALRMDPARLLPGRGERDVLEIRRAVRPFMRATHEEYYARMGWPHGDDCICKKIESPQP